VIRARVMLSATIWRTGHLPAGARAFSSVRSSQRPNRVFKTEQGSQQTIVLQKCPKPTCESVHHMETWSWELGFTGLATDIALAYLSPGLAPPWQCFLWTGFLEMITCYIASQPYRISTRIRARPIPSTYFLEVLVHPPSVQNPSASCEE
jgi:hypothetical protein